MDTNFNTDVVPAVLLLITTPTQAVPLQAEFCYSSHDPFAVTANFHAGADAPVTWIFARLLLDRVVNGGRRYAGDGDVRIPPGVIRMDETNEHSLAIVIELCSPFGFAGFVAPWAVVDEFLAKTFRLVPRRQESRRFAKCSDLDAWLKDLLRDP